MTIKYAIETLVHCVCNCGKTWTVSVPLEQPPFIPRTCPYCGTVHEDFEDLTEDMKYCGIHAIWYHTTDCPMCVAKIGDTFEAGYLAGLHDGPKLMELPGE